MSLFRTLPIRSRHTDLFRYLVCMLSLIISLVWAVTVLAQPSISWQKTIGTPNHDEAITLLRDDHGHMVIIGKEVHQEFTGNFRSYMVALKVDAAGQEIWKTYHDVAFNTFTIPVDYTISNHFYTEEYGDTLLNLIIEIYDRKLQYKILDRTGTYWTYEEIPTLTLDVNRENEKVYARTLCAVQQSCYGPDSLVVERFDPSPDSILFDPWIWRFELKQNIRPKPAQGHIDFNIQDIRVDQNGNTWVLVQLQRWDFQFCTDCADAFIDAYNEVFKFDPDGQLLGHVNLQTTQAVVSRMRLIRLDGGQLVIGIDDINAAGTKVITSVYHINEEMIWEKKFDMDQAYPYILSNDANHLFVAGNLADPQNPDIHGLTDLYLAEYNADGHRLWSSNFGGSDFDFARGLLADDTGGLVFLANTYSADFDVESSLGQQDIWLVKLEEGTTSTDQQDYVLPLSVSPNPASDFIQLKSGEALQLQMVDLQGRVVKQARILPGQQVDVRDLSSGVYGILCVTEEGKRYVGKWVKK